MQKEHSRAVREARQLKADYEIAQMKSKGTEARQIELLAYQGTLQKEAANWKHAYEALKEKDKIREEAQRDTKKIIE